MTKETARIVVAVVTIGLILHVLSSLVGSHYYRMTYSVCLREGLLYGPYCQEWTLQAIFEILAILALAAGAWIYNERRSVV